MKGVHLRRGKSTLCDRGTPRGMDSLIKKERTYEQGRMGGVNGGLMLRTKSHQRGEKHIVERKDRGNRF